MDTIDGLGSSAWPGNDRSAGSSGSDASGWAAALADALKSSSDSSTGGADGTTSRSAPTSMLAALQEMRMTQASDIAENDKAKEEGKAVDPLGLFTKKDESEADKTDLERTIDEIKEKGIAAWAHEQWLERIREKARQTALSNMGLTEDDLNHMSPELRAQVERIIKEIVDEAVREATEKADQDKDKKPTGQAKVLSPIITGGA